MNKELREFFNKNHIITKKITIKQNVKIIDTGNYKLVIKKRTKNLEELFKYLKSRGFSNFPQIIYKTNNYDIYEYIEDIEIPIEEKALDIIKTTTSLHNKTTYHKEIDEDYYKELYEKFHNNIDYLYDYYNSIATIIEKEEYMSPSNYLFIRNISKLFQSLNYCKYNIDKWYKIINEKKRIRLVNLHNNLSLSHLLSNNKPYLISWSNSKKDLPIYDLIKLYKRYYSKLDFCDLINNYEARYPLLEEEKILFFCIISIPEKLEFYDTEYNLCIKVKKIYKYLNTTEKLINDYFPNKKA